MIRDIDNLESLEIQSTSHFSYIGVVDQFLEALWKRLKSNYRHRSIFTHLKLDFVSIKDCGYNLSKVCMYAKPYCHLDFRFANLNTPGLKQFLSNKNFKVLSIEGYGKLNRHNQQKPKDFLHKALGIIKKEKVEDHA